MRTLVLFVSLVVSTISLAEDAPQLVLDPGGFLGHVQGVDISPGGEYIAAGGDYEVRIWSTKTHKLLKTIRGQRDRTGLGGVFAVAFSPDGFLLVGISDKSPDGSIRVYRVADGFKQVGLLSAGGVSTRKLAFSADGRHMASLADNGKMYLWDWPARKIIGSYDSSNGEPSQVTKRSIQFYENHLLAFGGFPAAVSIPDLAPVEPRSAAYPMFVKDTFYRTTAQTPEHRANQPGLVEDTTRFHWDRSSATLVMGGLVEREGSDERLVAVWSGANARASAIYRGHKSGTIQAIAKQGDLVVTGDTLGQVHLWNAKTGEGIAVLRGKHRPVRYAAWMETDSTSAQAGDEDEARRFGVAAEAVAHVRDLKIAFGGGPTRPEFVSNLATRKLEPVPAGARFRNAIEVRGEYSFRNLTNAANGYSSDIVTSRAANEAGRYLLPFARLMSAGTFLDARALGADPILIVADDDGFLVARDALRKDHIVQRSFFGHDGKIEALSASPDGRLLLSSGSDGTLRVWPLGDHQPVGDLDVRMLSNKIETAPPNSLCAKAGLRVGDLIERIDGRDLQEIATLKLLRKYPVKPGQDVTVEFTRNVDGVVSRGKVKVKTIADGDVVEPLVSMMILGEREWLYWTPEGYFDSSPGAESMIGWQLNQGKDKDAELFPVGRFKKQLYQPELIDTILGAGDREGTIRTFKFPLDVKHRDLRDSVEFKKNAPPVVTIKSPAGGSVIPESQFTVTFSAQQLGDSPLDHCLVSIDKVQVVKQTIRGATAGLREIVLDNVPPGDCEVTLVAVAKDGTSSQPASIRVKVQTGPAPERGRLYVLAFGVGKYKADLKSLEFPDDDATAFEKAVAESHNKNAFSEYEPKVLTDEKALHDDILTAFQECEDNCQPQDTVVVFLAGHGDVYGPKGNFYFLPHDFDPARYSATGLEWRTLMDKLGDFKARRKLLIFDACKSGGAIKNKRNVLHDDVPEGLAVFASCDAREISIEVPSERHGAFTAAILHAIEKRRQYDRSPANGFLNIAEFAKGIDSELDELRKKTKIEQKPQYYPDVQLIDRLFELLKL